ncbi:hypothetical protein DSC45_26820 [Streptomyces sp. YIM 130001]|uniref:SCO family protein n=1 Tax=Streptomyces sp. YIM 130001 TaxID=2259644 RepID=UPI000E656A21|nr:SCO family protein [Streptomyces sp. YIM 130001]RII11915.1 hypothetical protein DSC45_26820 [Streptomyces sp. YIM 130001]
MRKNRVIAAALLSAAALTLSACSSAGDDKDKPTAEVSAEKETKAATVLDTPFKKPDMILTDTNGKEFDLIERTKGKPTLVYFGYTNCPDVCPLTMSNLALALKDVPADVRKQLQVIMISSDPERDTPKELGKWLKGQDPSFIGLTGDFPTIQAGARTLGISIDKPVKEKDGSITSTHGKQVMAFSPKTDEGYVFYNGETTSADDYAKDLPKLAEGAKP